MAGVEVQVFLHLGDLLDVFQDVTSPQVQGAVEFHLAILLMIIMTLQKDTERDLCTAGHLLRSPSIMNLVGLLD